MITDVVQYLSHDKNESIEIPNVVLFIGLNSSNIKL